MRTRLVRFGVFELDLLQGELRKAGLRLNLPEQPFQLLAALLEQPGEIVTRDELQKRLWRGETFVDFDQGLNAAVKRLRDVLGDSADTPRFVETVPRRGYRFLGPVDTSSPAPASTQSPAAENARAPSRTWLPQVIGVILAAAALLVWVTSRRSVSAANPAMRVVALTSMRGYEGNPSFSPDGNAIAFAHSDSADPPNLGIYVVTIGSHEPRRLSPDHRTDGIDDFGPSWSPDGQHIAFIRRADEASHVYVMSPFGSAIAKVSDVPVRHRISWSADPAVVLASRQASAEQPDAGIYALPIDGASPRAITDARFPAWDLSPALSADGRRLAYARCRGPDDDDCEIFVLDVTAALGPAGRPRRVSKAAAVDRISWGPDGHSLIFGSLLAYLPYVWRVDIDGQHVPERLDLAGLGAWTPTVSPAAGRLAFSKGLLNPTVYRFDAAHGSRPLFESSFGDMDARFSADGRFIVLSSTRSGDQAELWVADASGQNPRQLTHGPGLCQGSPQWSPDGREVAFDSLGTDLRWHVWMIDTAGGAPRQLTHGDAESAPTWSADGNWVYYSTYVDDRHSALWKASIKGGAAQRVIPIDTGRRLQELDGGSALVYQTANGDAPLVLARVGQRPSRTIASCVRSGAFAVNAAGIFYVACGQAAVVHRMDLDGLHDRVIGTLDDFSRSAMDSAVDVSADGQTIIYNHRQPSMEFDLYLIENFR